MGSWFPVAGPIIGGIAGGVAGYLAGNYAGKEAGTKAATLLGVNQQAHLPAILHAAQRLHSGLIRRGVPPKEALEAARALLNGPMKDFRKIMARIRRLYGKNRGYVSVRHSQRDWYCTNRPVIKSEVTMPDLIREETSRVNKIRSMFGLDPLQTSE
jgi:phosphopantetheinyl transferase (holo-ACP synthase)